MDARMWCDVLSGVVGGLCIFLLGMKYMSEGMQAIAGERLRRLIAAVTDNPLVACGVGTAVTGIIQSSSVTTVMLVGLVNAGFMTLPQSIGVTLGADIGTTVTAWIVALDILEVGLPLLGVTGFFYLFARNERVRYSAMMLMGVGMVFFGLLLMKNGLTPLRTVPEFRAWFCRFSGGTFLGSVKCVMVGMILTAIVQSSSATVGITMVLAGEGTIPYDAALAMVLGENIGTTITAYLASLGASTNAKRAAYAHVLIKVVGAIWAVPLLSLLSRGVAVVIGVAPGAGVLENGVDTFPNAMRGIALFHTTFNVLNVALFLPMVGLVARVLQRFVPERGAPEVPHLAYLDVRMLDTPAIGIQESHNEIVRMSQRVAEMLQYLGETLESDASDEAREKRIFHREEVLDTVQKEVVEFVCSMLSGTVSHDVMNEGRLQLRMADEYESVSDYVVSILKLLLKLRKANLRLSPAGRDEIRDLHRRVTEYVAMVSDALRNRYPEIITKARAQGDMITHAVKEYRELHLTRLASEECRPLESLAFTDILTAYRRIKDHALNIAEAVAGEK